MRDTSRGLIPLDYLSSCVKLHPFLKKLLLLLEEPEAQTASQALKSGSGCQPGYLCTICPLVMDAVEFVNGMDKVRFVACWIQLEKGLCF